MILYSHINIGIWRARSKFWREKYVEFWATIFFLQKFIPIHNHKFVFFYSSKYNAISGIWNEKMSRFYAIQTWSRGFPEFELKYCGSMLTTLFFCHISANRWGTYQFWCQFVVNLWSVWIAILKNITILCNSNVKSRFSGIWVKKSRFYANNSTNRTCTSKRTREINQFAQRGRKFRRTASVQFQLMVVRWGKNHGIRCDLRASSTPSTPPLAITSPRADKEQRGLWAYLHPLSTQMHESLATAHCHQDRRRAKAC
jgi:hypothetical protein